jgi:hypothetical protein
MGIVGRGQITEDRTQMTEGFDFGLPWPPLSPSWRLYEPEAGL